MIFTQKVSPVSASWIVEFTSAAKKQKNKLPEKVQAALALLISELENRGPIRKDWPHFSPLGKKKENDSQ